MPAGASPPGRRPRPVAGLPVPAGVAVAKGWLLELLHHTALEHVAAVPAALLAREAPALCDAIIAAVADDAALERLGEGGDLHALAARAGRLSGASGPTDVVAAVEVLRTVLHRALRTDHDGALAADTGDRLAHVCAQVAAAALEPGGMVPAPDAVVAPAAPPEAAPVVPPDPAGRVLVAQDLRADPAHLSALAQALSGRDGLSVAVLAIEIDDRERLVMIDGEELFARDVAPVEEALARQTPADGMLVREHAGRWWLVAPGTDTGAARDLAHRCSTTVAEHAPVHHGVPLRGSIGLAVCPDDGTEAQALADHADQGVFTARALGVPVA